MVIHSGFQEENTQEGSEALLLDHKSSPKVFSLFFFGQKP